LELLKGLINGDDSIPIPFVVNHGAIPPDRAVEDFENVVVIRKRVFEGKLFVNPAGKLSALGHHLVIVVLAVS
jgi:hypothetical protein